MMFRPSNKLPLYCCEGRNKRDMQCRHCYCYYCYAKFRAEEMRLEDIGIKAKSVSNTVPNEPVDPNIDDENLVGVNPAHII